jgi:hypothetical protein
MVGALETNAQRKEFLEESHRLTGIAGSAGIGGDVAEYGQRLRVLPSEHSTRVLQEFT